MQEQDGIDPDCEREGKACLIPPLTEQGQRVMEIHSMLRALSGLIDSGPILSLYEVTKEDLEYLVIVQTELKKAQKPVN